jgi:hypothetical protein
MQSALAEGAARTAVVRVSWLPAHLGRVLTLVEQVARGTAVDLIGRATVGAGTIRIEGDTRQQVTAIELLRHSDAVGNVVVTSASTELKAACDVWGRPGGSRMFESVKRVLDPNGTLGAGRSSW